MDFEDFLEPEIAITAGVVAAITSPQVRKVVRQGAVYGLAGIIFAGDAVTSFARGLGRGVQEGAATIQPARETNKEQAEGASPARARGRRSQHESAE